MSLGELDSCFNENLVLEMMGGGLVSLLRACLDEREESVVFASTNCLASLIAPQVRTSLVCLYVVIDTFCSDTSIKDQREIYIINEYRGINSPKS